MNPISLPIDRIGASYTVVVIGSGYGGAVVASRLARAGVRVALLERGREFAPGAFPKGMVGAAAEFTVDTAEGRVGPENGLYWARVNPDVSVVCGSGLGGTSLINANVSLRPDARVFEDGQWPAEIAEDQGALLDEGFARAARWLQPNPYPDAAPRLPKMEAHRKSAEAMGLPFVKVPINVAFQDRLNVAGVAQAACTNCGDCVSGCNVGSKGTLRMNYLPDAAAHGAEIFCEIDVRSVERAGSRWRVRYQLLGAGRERFDAPESFLEADLVVVAAGALGSTEILLRSRERGLPVSAQLGQRFNGNADTLGFAFATRDRVGAVGFGDADPATLGPVGPCITSMVDARGAAKGVAEEMILEEGNIPGPIAVGVMALLEASAALEGERTEHGLGSRLREWVGELETDLRGVHHGVAEHTQVYLGIGMDDDKGVMSLEEDRLSISWSRAGSEPIFREVNGRMLEATAALKGVFVRDPIWTKTLGRRLVTVHPLGGCAIGDDATKGVVNHKHLVFTGEDARAVHEGLYVVDGSVVPSPLAVNPLLTITALAERCVEHIARDHGWSFDVSPRDTPLPEPPARAVGVRFTETMHGFYADAPDYAAGAAAGEQAGQRLRFVFTIQTEDLERTMADPRHPFGLTGTVEAPALSARPMTVTGGLFELFVADPARPGLQHMVYRAAMRAEDGRSFYLEGHKNLEDGPGIDSWPDATTLYTTLHEGADAGGPVLGRGVLRLTVGDLAEQLRTMQSVGAPDLASGAQALARFGRWFAGDMWSLYGPKAEG